MTFKVVQKYILMSFNQQKEHLVLNLCNPKFSVTDM